ncbi:MAG: chorismate-binding protein, partial [Bacteriovoracaceae bacterium]
KLEDGELLIKSSKDLHEHNIVVDDIKEKLSPFCNEIHIGKTYLHPFKHIVHLRTDFKTTIKEVGQFINLTTQMSPTAALGGYPMNESISFLKKTQYAQKFPQRIFGSVMGLVKNKELTSVVMIRNLQWMNEKFIIECGGGVVEESILENELSEISLKRSIIKKNYL